jgi:hypothetical protein
MRALLWNFNEGKYTSFLLVADWTLAHFFTNSIDLILKVFKIWELANIFDRDFLKTKFG